MITFGFKKQSPEKLENIPSWWYIRRNLQQTNILCVQHRAIYRLQTLTLENKVLWVVAQTLVPASGRWKQEDLEHKNNFSCIVSLKSVWATWYLVLKNKKQKGRKEGRKEGKRKEERPKELFRFPCYQNRKIGSNETHTCWKRAIHLVKSKKICVK